MSNENNTLYTVKESFLVVLDSRNATTYNNGTYNSDITFMFETPIEKPKNCLLVTCSVLQFSCPNSIYNINATNNILVISETISGNTIPYKIYFTSGNYNVNSFISAFNASSYLSNFNLTFNSLNNKFTITNKAGNSFVIGAASTIYNVMGFINGQSLGSVVNTLIMPFCCNFNGVQSVNIVMPCFNTSNIDSYDKTSSSIVQPIPIDSSVAQISFFKTHDYNFKINQDTIDHIHIQISDDLETLVDLNNQHWNLTLYFTKLLDIDRFHYENTFNNILQNGYLNI